MAKVLITEQYLSDIADAIREKKASEDTYNPSEMADAIESIQTGITPTGTKQVSITANGTTTENVTNYASAEITVNVPSESATLVTKSITENGTYNASSDSADGYSEVTVNVQSSGSLFDMYLTGQTFDYVNKTIEIPNNGTLLTYGIAYSGIRNLCVPKLKIGLRGLEGCSSLKNVVAKTLEGGNTCYNSTSLEKVDICGNYIGAKAFNTCSSLNVLVLRHTGITGLQSTNAFDNTSFASGGSGGTIYIPKALYDVLGTGSSTDYKAATNWSTIDGYGTITWAIIEGSQYETAYVDGTSISS